MGHTKNTERVPDEPIHGYSGNVQITPKQGGGIDAYLEVPHETTAGRCRHDRTIEIGEK